MTAPIAVAPPSWPLTSKPTHPSSGGDAVLVFGLTFAPEHYGRLLDMGPPSDSPAAAGFRCAMKEAESL